MSVPLLDSSILVILDSVIPQSITPASRSLDHVLQGFVEHGSLPLPQGPTVAPPASIPSLRRSSRPTKPFSYLQDYKCSSANRVLP